MYAHLYTQMPLPEAAAARFDELRLKAADRDADSCAVDRAAGGDGEGADVNIELLPHPPAFLIDAARNDGQSTPPQATATTNTPSKAISPALSIAASSPVSTPARVPSTKPASAGAAHAPAANASAATAVVHVPPLSEPVLHVLTEVRLDGTLGRLVLTSYRVVFIPAKVLVYQRLMSWGAERSVPTTSRIHANFEYEM